MYFSNQGCLMQFELYVVIYMGLDFRLASDFCEFLPALRELRFQKIQQTEAKGGQIFSINLFSKNFENPKIQPSHSIQIS